MVPRDPVPLVRPSPAFSLFKPRAGLFGSRNATHRMSFPEAAPRRFKRAILKLSGEALREPGSTDNISPEIVERIASTSISGKAPVSAIGLLATVAWSASPVSVMPSSTSVPCMLSGSKTGTTEMVVAETGRTRAARRAISVFTPLPCPCCATESRQMKLLNGRAGGSAILWPKPSRACAGNHPAGLPPAPDGRFRKRRSCRHPGIG